MIGLREGKYGSPLLLPPHAELGETENKVLGRIWLRLTQDKNRGAFSLGGKEKLVMA